MTHYDKDGRHIPDMLAWAKKYQDTDYKRIRETTLPDGRWVSTVWLGLDHNFAFEGPPLIFETMVFPKKGEWGESLCERYSTEEQAVAGHERIVESLLERG